MSNRILLTCYEIPGWGGAATVCYLLFEKMQKAGMDVSYVNLIYERDAILLRSLFGVRFGNPRNLANVHNCVVPDPLFAAHSNLAQIISDVAPDVIFCFGFIPANLAKLAAPHQPVVFMTAGCTQTRKLIEAGAVRDFMDFQDAVSRGVEFPIQSTWERKAVTGCDMILVHSPIVRFAFEHFFPRLKGKIYSRTLSIADLIYEEAEPYRHLARPFDQRDIDVLFIASMWSRPEKNYDMVRTIASHCSALRIHIVGEAHRKDTGAEYHNVVADREAMYGLLSRAKTVVCPSLLDAAPGIMFEASAMGCNVIASPNCGNWQLCNEALAARRCSSDEFINRIHLSVSHQYQDNQSQFRGDCADIIDVLSVF